MTTEAQATVETSTQPEQTPVETTKTELPQGEQSGTRNTDDVEKVESQQPEKDVKTKESVPVSKDTLSKVQTFLEDAGLQPSKVAKEFSENGGELSIESMKALVDKHGEAVASLIVGQLQGLHEKSVKQAKERDEAVFTQVAEAFQGITEQSGEETWKELAGWAKANVPNEERSELNALLAKGGLTAKLAVGYLVDAFKNSQDFQQPAELLKADNVSSEFGVRPLSKAEYTKELNVLLAKGHDYNTSPEIRALQVRRQKGLQRGM